MGLQNLFTEVKKLYPLLRCGVSKLGPIMQKIVKCVGKYRDPAIYKFASKQNSSPFAPFYLIFFNNT